MKGSASVKIESLLLVTEDKNVPVELAAPR